jgi:putative phosphoesterase
VTTRVVVLSDTHVRRGGSRRLQGSANVHLEQADRVLHAGDVVEQDLLDELTAFAPVDAVLGNNDIALRGILPEHRIVEVDGVRIALVHDSGPTAGRAARMRRRFPDASIVVFGHSHHPLDELGIDGQRLFNPGSPTDRRRAPSHTLGILEISAGSVTRHEIVDL